MYERVHYIRIVRTTLAMTIEGLTIVQGVRDSTVEKVQGETP